MSEWKSLQVRDVANVFDGPHATPSKTAAGPWFLSISSLTEGRLDLSESAHVSEEDFARWTRRVTPQTGDLLFSYETRLGAAALMPPGLRACLGRRMAILRPRAGVDPKFLMYAFLGPEFQETIRRRSVRGATVDRIPLNELPRWPIRLPSMPVQRAIASVLGVLDEKISLNENFEKVALELATYQYAAAVADSTEVRRFRLGEIVHLFDGPHATPKKVDHGPYFLSISSLGFGSLDLAKSARIDEDAFSAWTRRVAPKVGDVLFSYETRLGVAALMPPGVRACLGRRMGLLRPKSATLRSSILLHAYLAGDFQEMIRRKAVRGATVDRLPLSEMGAWEIALPSESAVASLAPVLDEIHRRIWLLRRENQVLVELRRTLLPNLMSGKLRIKDVTEMSAAKGLAAAG